MEILKRLAEDLRLGEDEAVREGTRAALEAGLPASAVLRDGLLAGMAVVGEEFGRREIFLPDVLLAARAMQAGMEVLRPRLARDGAHSAGRVVLGTVQGDLHDIGKNLVGILLRSAGFEVIDLGTDVPAARFVDAAVEVRADVVGLSALLTTTMPRMGEVVSLVESVPSTQNSTRDTPTLSDADAETLTVPEAVAPFEGLVMEAVGGVVSDVVPSAFCTAA